MNQDNLQNKTGNKLKIGWFSFTCCEDSTILLTELLNDHLDEWKKSIDFRFFKALKFDNSMDDLDVAFIEGAISSDSQKDDVVDIRSNAKYVVAIGSCACTGLPSASRNTLLNTELNEKIQWYLSHFDYSQKVQKIEDVIKVDDKVNGCPMNVNIFLELLQKYLKLFEII